MVVPPSTGATTFAAVNKPAVVEAVDHASTVDAASKTTPKPEPTMTASIPLSARRADALDLSSVERRGQPSQARVPPKRSRPQDIPEAPTFRPTEEEFRDPMEYMHKISAEGRKYGIVKIIPPDSWNPAFAIDTTRFHFRVRRQELNSVSGGTRSSHNYTDALTRFHKQHGVQMARFPSVDKRPLDLYKLKKAVEARGGFESVCRLKKWAEIGRDLGYSGKIMSSLSTSLKNSYQKWLQPYEEYLRVAKPGVQHQMELENGGPFTPSPGPSPIRKSASKQNSPGQDNAPMRASAALHASVNGSPVANGQVQPVEERPPQPVHTGFTAVNAGGFTAVNHAPGFNAVNGTPSFRSFPSEERATPSATPPAIKTETARSSVAPQDGYNQLKRQHSHPDGVLNGDYDERNTKRPRRDDIPNVVGSNMHQTRNPQARYPTARERSKEASWDSCEICSFSDLAKDMLTCESCDRLYHMRCLEPPVLTKPEFEWNCPKCLVGTGEYGFEEGEVYSLKAFQERAKRFKDTHFATKLKPDPITGKVRVPTEDEVEQEFWRLVENLTETVEVEYGADIHSTTHGSAFPTIEKQPRDQYSYDPWNLNVLPLYGESLFRHIKSDISGMTVPWLYVGMVFSTFCWHNEDHYAYSANYQHFGATKTWYGIPSDDTEKFEHAMREAVPDLFESQPDLLFQLVTLLPPEKLRKEGVRVYAIDQRAGEFVITFPQAYHAGFNHGFNLNEAVNFAPTDWEPYGEAGVERLRMYRKNPCFSHDELLVTAAARDNTIRTASWLAPALERVLQKELHARMTFLAPPDVPASSISDAVYRGDRYNADPVIMAQELEEDEYVCAFCKCYSYLSRYVCKNSGKIMCLLHAGGFECCQDTEAERHSGVLKDHVMEYRMTDEELRDLVSKVSEKARVPEAWSEKVEALLLDEPRPQLKTLRTLLHEGERIPSELPQLPDLRRFVERCNEWVEEATTYIQRKASRRKSDKPGRKSFARQAELEEQAKEFRKIDNIRKLLVEADEISFDCPEIEILRERAADIENYQQEAREALLSAKHRSPKLKDLEELVERGKAFNVDMVEIEQMEKFMDRLRWREEAKDAFHKPITKAAVASIISRGIELGLSEYDSDIHYFKEQQRQAELWDTRAQELMKVETISTPQLDSLVVHGMSLPVSPEILADVQNAVKKQKEAYEKVYSLNERSSSVDFRQRPMYKEARELLDALADVPNKPAGTVDLEKRLRDQEDWMRKGKKLFGKTNAPLHILLQHMEIVRARNEGCFDTNDKPRIPVEPSSRSTTPVKGGDRPGEQGGNVYCLCRKSEAGLMIECEICHEWYHSKCLKVARGKAKDEQNYKCPVCDWQQKIPRDADRPKLEELVDWQSDIPRLPYQPEEEECLLSTIRTAQNFRDFIQPFVNPMAATPDEVDTMRFYLRKVEGGDILLAHETNFLRQTLHRLAPVTDKPPPEIQHSGSTRKPRPTKQQKLMTQYGVSTPEELPEDVRVRATKRRTTDHANDHRQRHAPPLVMAAPYDDHGSPYSRHQSGAPPPSLTAGSPGRVQTHGQHQSSPGYGGHASSGAGMKPSPYAAPFGSPAHRTASGAVPPISPSVAASAPPSNIDPALFDTAPPVGGGGGLGVVSDATLAQSREAEEKMFADMTNEEGADK